MQEKGERKNLAEKKTTVLGGKVKMIFNQMKDR